MRSAISSSPASPVAMKTTGAAVSCARWSASHDLPLRAPPTYTTRVTAPVSREHRREVEMLLDCVRKDVEHVIEGLLRRFAEQSAHKVRLLEQAVHGDTQHAPRDVTEAVG